MIQEQFKNDLATKPAREIVQKYLLDQFPFYFKDQPDIYTSFRNEICEHFNIHPQNFAVVGSAKLGFSLAPDKYGKPFSDHSDIDVVLISDNLFYGLWLELLKFKRKTVCKLEDRYIERFNKLQHCFFYGVIRIDMLSDKFPFAKHWWEYFNKLSIDKRFGPRTIRGAIFKSWEHVSLYYENSIHEFEGSKQ